MFQKACSIYEKSLIQVGGITPGKGALLHGTGCLLSPVHFITALHVVSDAKAKYAFVAVSKYDGLLLGSPHSPTVKSFRSGIPPLNPSWKVTSSCSAADSPWVVSSQSMLPS